MSEKLDKARAELDAEFGEVKKSLGEVHVAYQAVLDSGPTDNVHDLLAALEKEVKAARDGGVIGSGSNDHRRALKKYLDLLASVGGQPT